MSLAGYTDEGTSGAPLVLRPAVAKTAVKGIIAVAAFSVFLQLSLANLVHYLIFLGFYGAFLLAIIVIKKANRFELGDETINVKRLFRRPNSVSYQDIIDISVSQGFLAKRFNCGTLFLVLKTGRGSVKLLGGGVAEQLDDVPNPERVSEFITAKLSPFSGFIEP